MTRSDLKITGHWAAVGGTLFCELGDMGARCVQTQGMLGEVGLIGGCRSGDWRDSEIIEHSRLRQI